ncbi:phosphotransferase [Synechocystis salina LEGE 00031]|uniref:Phosphotransferase n=1 Tax=Synechocystis salina LEGE 00031 TaxID=1828736 RepID=A0ABR9VXL4_9SYNC|nr:phosphotransferase [Synechocystis salina]MBE9255776.1 phosphotransferase [Synechocystis salina LEGE 00031]
MRYANVVIIEQDPDLFEDLRKKYEKLFLFAGYALNAHHASGQKDAQKFVDGCGGTSRIHVVISDIVAGATNEKRGLLWIQQLKKRYPDLLFIGNSGKEITYRETSVKLPNFDIYVDKQLLNRADNESYIAEIAPLVRKLLVQDCSVVIAEDSTIPQEFKNGHNDRELCSLVGQILFLAHDVDHSLEPTRVHLSRMDGGYSNSLVFRMEVSFGEHGIPAVPAILKISEPKKAHEEASNFKRYVKWLLPYSWRAELLGEGYTGRWGAVCYSFVRSGKSGFDNVTAQIRAGNTEAIRRVIATIFSPVHQTWYSTQLCSISENVELSNYYSTECFPSQNSQIEANRHFRALAQRLLNAKFDGDNNISFPDLSIKINEPNSILFSRGRGEFLTTISHGDMNSNNILLADNDEIVFIDFQNTGRKHVFFDFIVFEHSIRLHFPESEIDIADMIRFEGLISDPNSLRSGRGQKELPDMYELILELRKEAYRNFPSEPFENYLYAVTVFSLRLLRVDDFSDTQYTRLLTQLVSGMTRFTS